MSEEGLSGIGAGLNAEDIGDSDDEVRDITEELKVGDLSKLTDEEMIELNNRLAEDEEIEGVDTIIEGKNLSRTRRRETATQIIEIRRQELFRDQLDELQSIDDTVELLQRLGAQQATMNSLIEDVNSELADILTEVSKPEVFEFKDSDSITFEKARDSRDLTSDTSISTSLIIIKAEPTNDGAIFIGNDSVSVSNGLKLEPGEKENLRLDIQFAPVHTVAEKIDDTYSYIALGEPEE